MRNVIYSNTRATWPDQDVFGCSAAAKIALIILLLPASVVKFIVTYYVTPNWLHGQNSVGQEAIVDYGSKGCNPDRAAQMLLKPMVVIIRARGFLRGLHELCRQRDTCFVAENDRSIISRDIEALREPISILN